MDTEFWGVEVKAGQPVKCEPGLGRYLRVSQAALGEVKSDKGSGAVPIFVKVSDQKLVIGTLSSEKCAQISFDLVFEGEFELSHNWKHGSVYFCGYYTSGFEESERFSDSDTEDEEVPLLVSENGKSVVKDEKSKPAVNKANVSKPKSADGKPKVKIVEPNKATDEDDESDDDDSEEESDEDVAEAGDESDGSGEEEDSDDDSSEEDEATPKKSVGKKRAADSAAKTPVAEKKAKLNTPTGQKSGADGKKAVHTATPHPAKQAGKTPAAANKSMPQSPKSGVAFACKSCNKAFNSDNALVSHTKAKHSAGK